MWLSLELSCSLGSLNLLLPDKIDFEIKNSLVGWFLISFGFFQGFFTYLYMMSIMFLMYVFCYLLHESSCCGGPKQGTSGRNTYFQVGKKRILLRKCKLYFFDCRTCLEMLFQMEALCVKSWHLLGDPISSRHLKMNSAMGVSSSELEESVSNIFFIFL